jgi:hypothetical protein
MLYSINVTIKISAIAQINRYSDLLSRSQTSPLPAIQIGIDEASDTDRKRLAGGFEIRIVFLPFSEFLALALQETQQRGVSVHPYFFETGEQHSIVGKH